MSDPTGGLYPFLGDDRATPDPVLDDVRASTLQKAKDVTELRSATLERSGDDLLRAARIVAHAARSGGTVLAFGNGGSATDARDLAADLVDPPVEGWRSISALSLVQDRGVVTAVANDVGFENVFARQIIAYGEEGDVAVGFSTSGESRNVLEGFREAGKRSMATVGFAGYQGGSMAEEGFLDAVVVAPSSHIPRIQEAHATAYHTLLALVQRLLAAGGDARSDESVERSGGAGALERPGNRSEGGER